MVVPERESHWDYFHLLGSFEERRKFNYAVKLYVLFTNETSDDGTREYILTRVIQALGAVSNSMRAGAYSLLCTLLANASELIEYEMMKKIIDEHLKPKEHVKADPEANVGQLLAYKALIQTNFFKKTPSLFAEVAENLMELSMKKSYLHPESLRLLGQITVITKQEYGTDTFLRHLKNLDVATTDKLDYLFVLERNVEDSETLGYVFDGKRLLSQGTAPEMGILLAKTQNPTHGFYSKFFEAVADKPKYISKLWKTYEAHIKDKLENKITLNSYCLLVTGILQHFKDKKIFDSVQTIVSPMLIETLIQKKNSKESAKQVCRSISEVLGEANNPSLGLEILNKMVFHPGNFSFDEITGSKAVSTAVRTLGPQETKDFAEKCLEIVMRGDGVKNKDRLNALNMYCNLLEKPRNMDDKSDANDWKVAGLKTLLKAGLLDDPNISTELASAMRKSFFNSLGIKFPSLPAYAEALKELVKCFNSCLKKKLKIKVSDTAKETWELSQKLISTLTRSSKKVSGDKTILINALELITCYITLKSIHEPTEAHLNLTDLKSVLERIQSGNDSDEPEWIEVIMDLFLSMLSKKNASNRQIVAIVFKSMASHVNDGAFMQLLDVLRPGYDLKGQDEEQAESSDNEDESDDSDESNEEESEPEGEEDDEDNEEEDDDDDEEEDESDDEDMEDIDKSSRSFNLEKLQFDLRTALTPADSDNESIDIDDLDEEHGRQLDATLSSIFKNAKIKKPKEAKEKMTTHFRTRVLDLLETYCKEGMPMHHWLSLIPATLELANSLVATKNVESLKHRLLTFVKRISASTVTDIGAKDFDFDPLVGLIDQLITRAGSASGTEKELSEHFLEFVKFCIRNTNHIHTAKVESLKKAMENSGQLAVKNFCSERGGLHKGSIMIMQYLCTSPWSGVHSTARHLAENVLSTTTKPYKRIKGVELLSAYANSDRLFLSKLGSEPKSLKKLFNKIMESLLELKSEEPFDLPMVTAVLDLVVNFHEGKCSPSINWKTWKDRIPELLSLDLGAAKKLKPKVLKLCAMLGLDEKDFIKDGTMPMRKKQNLTNPNQRGQNNRKRKQVDARKLKKESKVRRLAAMDGLDNLSWGKLLAEE